jgi:hypothetical protein
MATTVVNIAKGEEYDVYIGRLFRWKGRWMQSPFGNPFSHVSVSKKAIRVDTREESVAMYREWIKTKPDLLAKLHTLKGMRLGCWCAPLECHGDVLVEMVEALEASDD